VLAHDVPGLHRAHSQRLWAQPLFDDLTLPVWLSHGVRGEG
jgi:hypothetical protein